MQGAVGKRLVVAVGVATAAVQRVARLLTSVVPPATRVTAANVCLCGAVVRGVPAVNGVDLTGLEPRDLFPVSQTFK